MDIIQMRTIEDATATQQKLTEMFPQAKLWHFPLAGLRLLPKESSWDPFAQLIITSKNAVRWLAKEKIDHRHIIFCVGEQTAALARSLGYDQIKYVKKNAASLMEAIMNEPKMTHFIYLRGKTIRHDICHDLKNAGYDNVQERIIYDLLPITQPFKEFPEELYQQPVVFLSYSYKQSLALCQKLDLRRFHQAAIIAISAHVASPFIHMPNIRVLWAKQPNEPAMFDCLLLFHNP